MEKREILVVEDDFAIRQGIVDALEFDDYKVDESDNGTKGLTMALEFDYDLLLLDLVLPGCSGLEILTKVRQHKPTQPIIILTARGEENDRVKGLRMGADDYMVKPFSIKELLARIESVLRRSPERSAGLQRIQVKHAVIDLALSRIIFDKGDDVILSERECELLQYLANNNKRVISRDEILRRVWRLEPNKIETRTIDMHISRLRDKLQNSKILQTVRGKGYMFNIDA